MLDILVLIFLNLASSGISQYNNVAANYNPYPIGSATQYFFAEKTCKMHLKRLCHTRDLDILNLQNRAFCEPSWVFDSVYRTVLGKKVLSSDRKCGEKNKVENDPGKYLCMKKDIRYDDCTGKGFDYRGTKDVTEGGFKCKLWAKQKKYNQYSNPINWNFCRNYKDKIKPWCYIDDKYEKWQYCDIKCKPFGKSDGCSMTMFSEKNFKGKNCTFSVDPGLKENPFKNKKNNCYRFTRIFLSYKTEGTFCYAVLKKWHTLHLKIENVRYAIYYVTLYDTSPDVVLLPSRGNDYGYSKYKNFARCSPHDVDNAENLVDFQKKENEGIAYINGRGMVYKYGDKKNSKFKRPFCCDDENISLSKELLTVSTYKKACNGVRIRDFESEGEKVTYYIPERVCTNSDINYHFNYYLKRGPTCIIEVSRGRAVITGGNKAVFYPVCCCEDACLPITHYCVKNEDCCTKVCIQNYCDVNKSEEDGKKEEINDNPQISAFVKILTGLALLILLSWFLRCCFPERRLLSQAVKIHEE